MRKHCISHLIPISIIILLIFPHNFIKAESPPQKPDINIKDYYSMNKPSLKLQQVVNPNKTLLPKGNFSVTEFWGIEPKFTYNATILSLNTSHWHINCNYSRTLDWDGSEFPNEFSTSVLRESINHTYFADNYYNWFGEKSSIGSFDYWINTTGFFVGYKYTIGPANMHVLAEESLYRDNIGRFDAWKINMTAPDLSEPITYWYSRDGLFLSLYLKFISDFWFNLTAVEIAELPLNYNGPFIGQISPRNNTRIANGSIVDIQFLSPYGIDIINYKWDSNENQSSTLLQTIIPSKDGSHNLYVTVTDNVGLTSYFYFLYYTDYSLPGIFLFNIKNNSRIQGSKQINFLISNGNGSIIYNWNGVDNSTIAEDTPIIVPINEDVYELNIFVMSFGNIWAKKRFIFTIDNSPPLISLLNLQNNSVIKSASDIQLTSSETGNITVILDNEAIYTNTIEANLSQEISLPSLLNGSHQLLISVTDEALNNESITIFFSVHTSAFNWNWELEAEIPRTIKIINTTSDLWFILTITSSVDQSFNLTVVPEDSYPKSAEMIEYAIEFNCEELTEIIFMSLTLHLSTNTSVFPVYQWVYWDVGSGEWLNITTSYNEVSHSWEATLFSYVPYFALINPGIITTLTSITPGGGQIPAFEIIPALLSLMMIALFVYRKRNRGTQYISD